MTSQYRHRRSSNPATAFTTLEPGEIAVNTANRQIAVGDAASGAGGAPLPLIPLRYFDTRAKYVIGDLVVNSGVIYSALAANGPGVFTPAQWHVVAGGTDAQYVLKTGDTMTGALLLSGLPTLPGHAASKAYVDSHAGGSATLIVSDTPPPDPADNTLWWHATKGVLYVRYNDGNSAQWVIATPTTDISALVAKAGDTMTGSLTLSGNPTAVLHATPKQYVDLNVGARVAKAGDTMSGDLYIKKDWPSIVLNTVNTGAAGIGGWKSDKSRWWMRLGDGAAETGGNAGSNFDLVRYADNGTTVLGTAMTINRANGAATFNGDLYTARNANEGVCFLGSNGQHYVYWSGSNYVMPGGRLTVGAYGSGGLDVVTVDQLNTKQANLGFTPVQQSGALASRQQGLYRLGR